jgi:16S rRNA U1498 N3-methylase RsmE
VLLQRSVAGKAAQIQQLNVQPLSSGTYVLRVSTANETATTKLIK